MDHGSRFSETQAERELLLSGRKTVLTPFLDHQIAQESDWKMVRKKIEMEVSVKVLLDPYG